MSTGWKKRWCIFSDGSFRYYKNKSDRQPAGSVPVNIMTKVVEAPDEAPNIPFTNCFELCTTAGRADFMLAAETPAQMQQVIKTKDEEGRRNRERNKERRNKK